MEKLTKAYEAIELLETLGLPISIDQQRAITALEREYLETEILPLIKQEFEPMVSNFRGRFNVEITFSKENGLDVSLHDPLNNLSRATEEPVRYGSYGKSKTKRFIIRVVFPDGHVIQHQQVLQTLVEVVEFAGAENVRRLNISTVTGNLISDDNNCENERYVVGMKQLSTGCYVQTYSCTDIKYEQIKRINRGLNLGLQVEKVLLE